MTQADEFNVQTEGPATPTDIFGRANASFASLLSQNSGASRPDYVTESSNGVWCKEVSTSLREVYLWDGVQDILLYSFNPLTGANVPNLAGIIGNSFRLDDTGLLLPRGNVEKHAAPFTIYAADIGKTFEIIGDCTGTFDSVGNLAAGFYCEIICRTNEFILAGGGANIDGSPNLTFGDGEGAFIKLNADADEFIANFGGGSAESPGGLTQIGSTFSYSGGVAFIETPDFPETYSEIVIQMEGMSPASTAVPRCVLFQGGPSPAGAFLSLASDYEAAFFGSSWIIGVTPVGIMYPGSTQAGHTVNAQITLKNYQAGLRTEYDVIQKHYTPSASLRTVGMGWTHGNVDGTRKARFDFGGTVQLDAYTLKVFGKR